MSIHSAPGLDPRFTLRRGNIFTSRMQTLVNTVNCVGVMGEGLALECRLRYPCMFARYAQLCAAGQLAIGKLWLYRKARDGRWILNFPTKEHWRLDSRPEYLEQGLAKFCATYREQGITSVAFPLLGAQHGGLAPEQSLDIMARHLAECDIPVEIWEYDPAAPDDLYAAVAGLFGTHSSPQLCQLTGLGTQHVARVHAALAEPGIKSLLRLREIPKIGEKTLEKLFRHAMHHVYPDAAAPEPPHLDDLLPHDTPRGA